MLRKYGAQSGEITDLQQFEPETHEIEDDNKYFLHCLEDIRLKLYNMGSVVVSNEALRCEFISSILHACVRIVSELTKKKISLRPQLEVVGDESTGRVDYAIKSYEELICITEGKEYDITPGFVQNILQCESAIQENTNKRKREDTDDYVYGIVTTAERWFFIRFTSDGVFCTSQNPLYIHFVETALVKDSRNEKVLIEGVKQVMEVIVGLLKARVDIVEMPELKRPRRKGS